MSESEQNTRENIRVCREEKPASCELCLYEWSTKSTAVYLCVQCCVYYCDKHKYVHSHRIYPPNEKHTEIAFNETKELRKGTFKQYLEILKADNLDFEFNERKITLSGLIDIRHESRDSKKCCITGVVLLNDGRLALVDQNNNCIKFLNSESQKITSYMQIPFKPRYLSEYENGKGVVTCPDNKRLLLLDLNTYLIIKVIRVDGACLCVGSLRDMFIVSVIDTDNIKPRAYIQIMNRDGKGLKLLRCLRNYPVFIRPYYVVVDKDRELFYVQNSQQSAVMCFNFTGTMLNRYKHEQLKHPQAMTIGPEGDVYVTDTNSRNIHKLSPLLKESQIIIDKIVPGGLYRFTPSNLCISRSQTLYASQYYFSPACNYISFFREE